MHKCTSIHDSAKIEVARGKILELNRIVSELEVDFPERHFTLDGHLIGSIGEVMAEYYYGVNLSKPSSPRHDGNVGDREVQVKMTQRDNVLISSKPEFLLVLYLTKTGDIYEVYNGPGKLPWEKARIDHSHNYRHIRVNKLMELDAEVRDCDRIAAKKPIEKMRKAYKNPKK